MKKYLALLIVFLCFASPALAEDEDNFIGETLSGSTRLACETILCLSSPERPSECNPALSYFFGIRKTKNGDFSLSRTIKARTQFLQLCPTSADAYVGNLAGAIANTMNQCDVGSLNKRKLIYARQFNVVQGIWAEWKLLGKHNSDFGTRNNYKFSATQYPSCSPRQLNYAENVRLGREKAPYKKTSSEETYWVYPAGQQCFEAKTVVDPSPPSDCQQLYRSAGGYDDLKYESGKWIQ